jgi:hypothetical protein
MYCEIFGGAGPTPYAVPGTDPNSNAPSGDVKSEKIDLVWEQPGTGIKYWNQLSNTVVTIAPNAGTDINTQPAIAHDHDGNSCIVWAYTNGSTSKIKFQKRSATGVLVAGSEKEFVAPAGTTNISPSIADFRFATNRQNDLTLTWNSSEGVVVAQYAGNVWGSPYIIDLTGSNAAVGMSKTPFDPIRNDRYLAYITPSSPLYSINAKLIVPPVTLQEDINTGWDLVSVPVAAYDLTRSTIREQFL